MSKIENFEMPDELYYHSEHSWAKVEGGKVRVGMTDFFQSQAGAVVYVDLPDEDDDVEQGEVCGKIQTRKWIGKLVAPVSGTVAEINEELDEDNTLINKDPYNKGWVLVIEPSSLEEDLANLIHGDKVVDWIKSEIKRAEDLKAKGAKE
ncbi:MAG: glycine cleavage system protein H [Planctomycetes bacterium]|nr:glycine cleavage system protein H [Planctomycetota bacterium]MBI5374725.1 glycine cleavage system protein H [Candidatus Schekmanbacteria bacterium]